MTLKVAVGYAIKKFLGLLKFYAKKYAKKAVTLFIILFALGFVGLLPRCPFRALNNSIYLFQYQAGSWLDYAFAFIPITEMLMFLLSWTIAIIGFHAVKIKLRLGKIIS